MAQLVQLITSKPDWKNKIADKKILRKWQKEFIDQDINPDFLPLVIDVATYDSHRQKEYEEDDTYNWVLPTGVKGNDVSIKSECKCDCLICEGREYVLNGDASETVSESELEKECKCTIKKLVRKKKAFLNKFVIQKQDLIDEELYTRFLAGVDDLKSRTDPDYHPGSNKQMLDIVHPSLYPYAKGFTLANKDERIDPSAIFHWLPSEFRVKSDGSVKIKSYINNLDPDEYSNLYTSIEKIFEQFVPMFNKVLKTLKTEGLRNKDSTTKLSNCQVVVKIAECHPTSKNPLVPEGSWHLEGLIHDRIIATGIYYYEMTNITDNTLSFRTTIDSNTDINYNQDCPQQMQKHYGLDGVGDANREYTFMTELGEIATTEGLCVAFPNFMQHKVSEYSLENAKKKGCRKILVFFLVDPDQPILSTSDVDPQQQSVSLEDAHLIRELLMYQRKYEIRDQSTFFERPWSLCEH